MPVYVCRVADASGKIEQFLRDAASEDSLVRELSAGSLFVLSVKEQEHQDGARGEGKRFSRKLIRELTDLLTIMLGSGLSLKDSLEVAQTVSSKGPANELLTLLIQRIRKGDSFASALDAAGKSFPSVYRGMVKIGERIGSLEQVFSRLSAYLSDEKKLRERFSAALIYPAIVLSVALLSAVLIVTVLFPRLREIFSEIGQGMAGRVESLMGSLTTAFVAIGTLLLLATALAVLMIRARRKDGTFAVRIDAFLLRVPLVASFLMQRELLNFSFAMETLTAAGVSVEEALSEGAGAVGNHALKKDIRLMREKVMKGERLSLAFAHSALFPESIARWIGIGERVGHVAKVFGQLRTYYQQEVEKWINRLMALIEPAIIVFLGLLIILFVVFFIIPIFSLYGNIL
jgi:type II secretory pathway component PulF